MTVKDFSVGFSDVKTANAVQTAATTTIVDLRYILSIENSSQQYSYMGDIELVEEASDVWSFSVLGMNITLNLASKQISLDGSFIMNGKTYTLVSPILIGVEEKKASEKSLFSILGSLEAARLKDCDIAPYISQVVSADSWANPQTAIDEWNVLFVEDASDLPSGAGSSNPNGTYPDLADILAAYNDGLVIAALYPDSDDIDTLCNVLSLENPPVLSGDNSHLELFAVAKRKVNGDYEPFSYTITDLDEITSGDVDETVHYMTSADMDELTEAEYRAGTPAPETVPAETTDADFNKDRIKDFVEWVAALDTNPESLRASQGNAAVTTAAGSSGQLTELAKSEGPDTINMDYTRWVSFSWIKDCIDEYPVWGRTKLNDSDGEAMHAGWTADRRTRLKYDVYSIHSFDKNRDYFLVRAHNSTNTQNQFGSVINCRAKGIDHNLARLMFGFTRRMLFNHVIEQDDGKGNVAIVASAPANKSASQTTSTNMGYSFGGKVAVSANITKAEISASAEFNFSINYSTSVSTTAIDYEIARRHNGDSKKRANACWEYIFSWPKEGQDVGDWSDLAQYCFRELEAWPSSKEHTSHMEWIWEVKPEIWDKAKDKKLLTVNTNVEWDDGQSQGRYYRRMGTYWGNRGDIIGNSGKGSTSFTLKRPPHIAVRPAVFSPTAGGKGFDKNAGNASFVLLSESDWTVKADDNCKDWVKDFSPANGTRTGNMEKMVTFSYAANNTGKPRTGTITVSNKEGDSFQIQVNQGAN